MRNERRDDYGDKQQSPSRSLTTRRRRSDGTIHQDVVQALWPTVQTRVRDVLRKGRLPHHDVEDATQEIFISLWRYDGWTRNPPRRSDVVAVAVTAAVNRVRDRARRRTPSLVEEVPDCSSSYLVEDAVEWRLQLEETLRVLTPKQRTLVTRAVFGESRGRTKREQDRLSLQLRRIRLALRRHIDVSWGPLPVVRWWRDATARLPEQTHYVGCSAAMLATLAAGLLLPPPAPPASSPADLRGHPSSTSQVAVMETAPNAPRVHRQGGLDRTSATSPVWVAPASPPTPRNDDHADVAVNAPSLGAGIEADLENERQQNEVICIGVLPVVNTLCVG